jgi:hypothetical protein
MLGCIQPMSSPMMNRMFGLVCPVVGVLVCARAAPDSATAAAMINSLARWRITRCFAVVISISLPFASLVDGRCRHGRRRSGQFDGGERLSNSFSRFIACIAASEL